MYKLRELERNDVKKLNEWRNNPELINMLGAPFRYINSEVDFAWFDNYMKSRSSNVRCAILDGNDEFIGVVSLTNINTINQSAEFHIMIGDEGSQNKGAGTYATKSMLSHAFENLNLNRIELTVLVDNYRAIKMYEKIGFRKEGELRNIYYKNGNFKNAYIYSILKEEYIINKK